MSRKGWIDFKQLREQIEFADVLEAYGVEGKRSGDQFQAFCPLPGHLGKGSRSPSFSARLVRPFAFQCFSCGAKGNALDFVALIEGLDPDKGGDIRMAALMMQKRFLDGSAQTEPDQKKARGSHTPKSEAPIDDRPRIINEPIDFELKLDTAHPYLAERNLDAETIERFGLGYCSRGLMRGRISIPIHDAAGQLIGYAGRLIDEKAIDKDNPKYRFPGPREKKGSLLQFKKSLLLYNAHRLDTPVDDLLVVEGFFSLFWMVQCGYPNVVALMGASCSAEQGQLMLELTKPASRIWIIPDGDDAGRRCAGEVLLSVAHQRFTRWIKLEEGQEPEDFYGPSTCTIKR